MARRMYDLDNGIENIKVKDITCNKITAVTSAITTEYDALHVGGTLSVGMGKHVLSATNGATLGGFVRFPLYSTANRPILTGEVGSVIYDATLGKLIIWNGTAWLNVDGTPLS